MKKENGAKQNYMRVHGLTGNHTLFAMARSASRKFTALLYHDTWIMQELKCHVENVSCI